jgi:hypothetical protein
MQGALWGLVVSIRGRRFSFLGLFSGFSSPFLILFLYFSYTFLILFFCFLRKEKRRKEKKSIRKAKKSIRKVNIENLFGARSGAH